MQINLRLKQHSTIPVLRKSSFLIILLVLATYFLTAQEGRYSFMDKFKVDGPAKLDVSATDGYIHVSPKKGDHIEVYYIVKEGTNFLNIEREALDKFVILETEQTGNKIRVIIRRRNENKKEFWRDQYIVSCKIYVPDSTSCQLTTAAGNVQLSGLYADQSCTTADGNVVLRGIEGMVKGETSAGHIKATDIEGNVNFKTSDGNIQVKNVIGDANFETRDGGINMENILGVLWAKTEKGNLVIKDCSWSITGSTTVGDIRGNIKELKGKTWLVTRDGNINVVLPDKTGMTLKMRGKDLIYPQLDFDGKITEFQIQGAVNGGGPPVELRTADGIVNLTFK